MDDERLLLRDAANRAGVTLSTLRHAILENRLEAELLQSARGPYYVVTVAEIDRYIAERRPHYPKRKERPDGR